MYTIKRDYNDETKEILKRLNGGMFNGFSRIDVDLKNNQLILNDIDKTVINYKYEMTVQELIHANYGSIKSLYLIY